MSSSCPGACLRAPWWLCSGSLSVGALALGRYSCWLGLLSCAGARSCSTPYPHDSQLSQEPPALVRVLAWAPAPYAKPGALGEFGMVHHSGWKRIGMLYAKGKLAGDFASNDKPELTAWYVPNADRLLLEDADPCGSKPRDDFIADDPLSTSGRWLVVTWIWPGTWRSAGVELPNGRGITLYEIAPAGPW